MPGPSDIRVNPFNNATNYVNLTERHIVPSVSPFVVRLNEVPEKQDPSNMQMFYVDDTTGQTTETALTEVAATPGAGEFRPDYSTNAFDDTSWNTGLIEFSSADAGKIIEVSYTATGTLAGVKTNRYPAWWLDRGDGSDGAFNPTGNTTISGEKNYSSVFIKAGVTVSVNIHATIKCSGGFINNGTITANGKGASGGNGGVDGGNGSPGVNGTVSNGGAGSNGRGNGAPGGVANISNIRITSDIAKLLCTDDRSIIGIGSGGGGGGAAPPISAGGSGDSGGNGGNGGGSLRIVCRSIKNNGIISANGMPGTKGPENAGDGGGGGGGSITIIADRVIKQGNITANAGTGAASGSNGIVFVKEIGTY